MSVKTTEIATIAKYDIQISLQQKTYHITTVNDKKHAIAIDSVISYCLNSSMGAPSSHLMILEALNEEAYSKMNQLFPSQFNIQAAIHRENQEWARKIKNIEDEFRAKFQNKVDQKLKQIRSFPIDSVTSSQYPDVPLPTYPVTKTGEKLPLEAGIYFIWDGEVCEYVGQSIKIANRVRLGHPKILTTDKISYLKFDISELNFAEAYYIGIMRPRRNFIGERL